jgi:hypothetical protein
MARLDRRTLIAYGILAVMAGPSFAKEPAVFTGLVKGVAVGGYDPVAYFRDGRPAKGSGKFAAKHAGVAWHFSSAANRDAFLAAPNTYAPAFGGYCAWAVSRGYTAKGDPRHWKIVGGRLYLNYSAGVQKQWAADIPGNIAKGKANWPKVLD